MPALIVTVDEESLCKDIKNLVRNTVEETPNAILVAGRLFRQVDFEQDSRRSPSMAGITYR